MTLHEKLRVLVLDDDPAICAALERLLRQDFQIISASNLVDARKVMEREHPELAMIDLHLATGTSLDFFRELQINSPLTVRVLMSGDLHLDSLLSSIDSSLVHKVLQKPWEPASLLVQMKEARQLHYLLKEKRHLEQISSTDAMTGLYNFRYFQEFLPKEIERARRQGRPLSLIMMDVDHFKEWNDSKGHVQGSAALKDIARAIQESLRNFDCVCRYGGDEFCVLLLETDINLALEIAERIRARVEAKCPLTLSLGISSFPHPSDSVEKILADADRALYLAKNQGRNRCHVAGSPIPS